MTAAVVGTERDGERVAASRANERKLPIAIGTRSGRDADLTATQLMAHGERRESIEGFRHSARYRPEPAGGYIRGFDLFAQRPTHCFVAARFDHARHADTSATPSSSRSTTTTTERNFGLSDSA